MREDDLEKIKLVVKQAVDESMHGNFHVPAEEHYQDHLFVASIRRIWRKAAESTGRVLLVGLFVILLGVGIFSIKFLGIKLP